MTRRLLLGYLGVTLFVLLSLEVPLGLQNQRTERRDLTAKVSHDAMVLAADSEDAVQAPSRRQLNALAAIAADYGKRTGARVVIVDRQGFAYAEASLSGRSPQPVLMPTTVVLRESTAAPPPKPLGGHAI